MGDFNKIFQYINPWQTLEGKGFSRVHKFQPLPLPPLVLSLTLVGLPWVNPWCSLITSMFNIISCSIVLKFLWLHMSLFIKVKGLYVIYVNVEDTYLNDILWFKGLCLIGYKFLKFTSSVQSSNPHEPEPNTIELELTVQFKVQPNLWTKCKVQLSVHEICAWTGLNWTSASLICTQHQWLGLPPVPCTGMAIPKRQRTVGANPATMLCCENSSCETVQVQVRHSHVRSDTVKKMLIFTHLLLSESL